eukprot:TRINITY_DN67210_c8_g1_i3.p2 TRINITY_DN67210_c8_g1~~TRINITY_DN67210_c8_g1_i3.p2  ORF type:complete len:282 (+),score=22.37 TRINITY_DN67210_c8_g1_i3:56-901(+)
MKQVVAASALLHRLISRLVPPKVWLQQQRQQWETDKAVVDALNDQQHDVVYLRTRLPQGARGTQSEFHIRRSTLTSHSDSLFSVWLSQDSSWDTANDEHSPDGCLMITDDPHPHMFREIICWLRAESPQPNSVPFHQLRGICDWSEPLIPQMLSTLSCSSRSHWWQCLNQEATYFGLDTLLKDLNALVVQLVNYQQHGLWVALSVKGHVPMAWNYGTTQLAHAADKTCSNITIQSWEELFQQPGIRGLSVQALSALRRHSERDRTRSALGARHFIKVRKGA